MNGFNVRLNYDRVFKEIIRDLFDTFLKGTIYYKNIGVEEKLADLHEHIRFKRDVTTEYVRYSPDGFICWNKSISKESLLVELKTATTGWKLDNARPLVQMRQRVPDLKKEEVVNIELGSYENLVRIRNMGIDVIILIYISYHPIYKWLAIVPDNSLNLLSYGHDEMRQTTGSGTPIANLLVRVDNKLVYKLPDWISERFGISPILIERFLVENEKRF